MKIFFLLKYFLPAHVAGTEVYVHALAKALQASGEDVSVVLPNYTTEPQPVLFDGIPLLYYAESSATSTTLQKGFAAPQGLQNFKDLLLKEKPDVVHVQEISGSNGISIFHLRVIKELNIPLYCSFHLLRYVCVTSSLKYLKKKNCNGVVLPKKCTACTLSYKGIPGTIAEAAAAVMPVRRLEEVVENNPQNFLQSFLHGTDNIVRHKGLLEEIFFLSNKVVVLNDWYKNILLLNEMPVNKIEVIKQGLPLSFSPTEIGTQKSENLRLVYMGRICFIKGLKVLLSALVSLNNNAITLDIYGAQTEPEYAASCKNLGKQITGVAWHGVAKPNEVVGILKQYDVHVFPTIVQEVAPFSILETQAAGVYLLASDNLAGEEAMQSGVPGRLFKMADAASLASNISELFNNREILPANNQGQVFMRTFDEVAREHLWMYQSS